MDLIETGGSSKGQFDSSLSFASFSHEYVSILLVTLSDETYAKSSVFAVSPFELPHIL